MGKMKEQGHTITLSEEDLGDALHTMNAEDFDRFIKSLHRMMTVQSYSDRRLANVLLRHHTRRIHQQCADQINKINNKQCVTSITEDAR